MRPYLRVANVHEDRIESHDINHMNFTDAEFERFRLVEGDVLLNEGQRLELVGRPAIYRGEIPECCSDPPPLFYVTGWDQTACSQPSASVLSLSLSLVLSYSSFLRVFLRASASPR